MLTLPSQLTSYSDKVDGSARLSFVTRELQDAEIILLRRLRGMEGWLLFGDTRPSEEDIPKVDPDVEQKTPGQRLRSVLFLLWKQSGEEENVTFTEYYKTKMELIISRLKGKLDD